MHLRVVSDGTVDGTRVMDLNGRILEGVQKVSFTVDAQKGKARLLLEVVDFDLEVDVPDDKTKIKVRNMVHMRT